MVWDGMVNGIVCNILYYGMACDLISCHFVIPHVMCVWMNAWECANDRHTHIESHICKHL